MMPFCGIFEWDMELGKPALSVPVDPTAVEEVKANIRRVIAHNEARWLEQYIETMPYWGA